MNSEENEVMETVKRCIAYNGGLHGRYTDSGIRYCELSRLTDDFFCKYLGNQIVRKVERDASGVMYVVKYHTCEKRK